MRARATLAWLALVMATGACVPAGGQATGQSPSPSFMVTTPRPFSSWASFTTGAGQSHLTRADGLQITDVSTGGSIFARNKDLLTVQYAVWLQDGTQIGSSDTDGKPFKFTLGMGEVIAGWDEGLVGMGTGGIRRLVIPPALAYGAAGVAGSPGGHGVPPNATLVSVIWLVQLSRPM